MPSAMEIYSGLRKDLAAPQLAALKIEVRAHLDRLILAQQRNELVAIDLAHVLCDRLETLLAMAHQLEPESRAHIVGAARYFISTSDAVPDDRSCTGLDDDVAIFNHVVRALDRQDLVITE